MGNKIMFETADWQRFVTMDMLTAEAGVSRDKIAKLVAKELADNACDVGNGTCIVEPMGERGFSVQDFGPGIDVKDVADIFSIRRPLRSTKYLRLPVRGALGNGLRVVVGAVLCTGGTLVVHTRGKVLNLVPQQDGYTKVEEAGNSDCTSGTRVEVTLGPDAGPRDLSWAYWTQIFAATNIYSGKTSAHWYTAIDFYALCQRAGQTTVDDLVHEFDGCAARVGEVASGFVGITAASISQADACVGTYAGSKGSD